MTHKTPKLLSKALCWLYQLFVNSGLTENLTGSASFLPKRKTNYPKAIAQAVKIAELARDYSFYISVLAKNWQDLASGWQMRVALRALYASPAIAHDWILGQAQNDGREAQRKRGCVLMDTPP
jgi:hypothetical protein